MPARNLAREQTVKGHTVREPLELIDQNLHAIAGGAGLGTDITLNVNVAVVDQLIEQIQVLSSGVTASAANFVAVSQTS